MFAHILLLVNFVFSGSERNVSKLTLDGVDVMGERLAEEVGSIVRITDIEWFYLIFCN